MDFKDIPKEVLYIQMMEAMPFPWLVGIDEYNRVSAVKAKYPEYFPWDRIYESIPKEVHDAYRNEKNPDWDKPIEWIEKGDRGIEDLINDSTLKVSSVVTEQDFMDLFEMLNKSENDEYKKKMADEALWNKHYGKYKLKYRG